MTRAPAARFRPRKAPVQRRSTQTVEAILGAAARILVSRGWSELTTNHVAKRAGVSIGTLYEYFPGKEALVTALVERHLERAEALLASRASELAMGCPSVDALSRAIVETMVALHEDAPRLHRALFEEVPHPPAIRARVRAIEARHTDALAMLLTSMRDVDVPDAHVAARIVVDVLESAVHRWACDPSGDPIPREQLIDELARLVKRYLSRG
ncbi:TetR/AcrR family transcriptional regulator [Sandaracinus amylolyticus]|uniref:Transcriptional regulator, TetR family protein n=1 Tax=Sandaracinus amylolyticus TaxID=927083 RepID=A0A0F6W1X0_9BACT|nr:TetR/AcrR family transcriptional regulator [Sandaracinus amylolyticus]AKF05387.1 Transcriptional regulator, TetR family protein [Sandaracinus amylolyticus]